MGVYFLRPVGARGPVKIGCSINAERRLVMYASWSPAPLEIAAEVPEGGLTMEHQFHALLWDHHSHGEWFRDAPEVRAVVDAVRSETFDFTILPATGRRPTGRINREHASIIAGANTRRLTRLVRGGLELPPDVEEARWSVPGEWKADRRERQAIVAAFLAEHDQATKGRA